MSSSRKSKSGNTTPDHKQETTPVEHKKKKNLEYDAMSLKEEVYLEFLESFRTRVNSPDRFSEITHEYINVILEKKELTLNISRSDVYLDGITINGITWRFGMGDGKASREGERYLGFDCGYDAMGGLDKIRVGFGPFMGAVSYLVYNDDIKKDIGLLKSSIGTIIVTICEGARFGWLSEDLSQFIGNGKEMVISGERHDMIKGWQILSNNARSCRENRKLTEDEEKHKKNREKLFEINMLAKDCVKILCAEKSTTPTN